MAFHLYRSNRTERLVDVLAEVAAQPRASVLAPEWIVVSSPGMERWLSMQLAQRVGVWANPAFPFPRKLVDTLLAAGDPSAEAREGYEPSSMAFGIARELAAAQADPRFAEVQRYCENDTAARRRLALSIRLAELFDQYLTYRSDLVLDWMHGGGEGFQPELFRALAARHGEHHLAGSARRTLAALRSGAPLVDRPERIHLFGLSSIPPLYLELLAALSQHHDVHLYLLSPTREYYADMRPVRARGRRRHQRQQLMFEDPGFQLDSHALLTSFGRHAREFQELLEDKTAYFEAPRDLYVEPGDTCLLHVLQSDLLHLRSRGEESSRLTRHRLDPADDSFAVHACHSPMRELEVLHDQLARLIAERGVEPSEILVMAPNISDYAKVIDAVFSQPESQRPVIPFRIADRGVAETQPLFLALDALLDVLEGRFGANQVLDLLGFDLIRERFEIAIDQLDELRAWLEDTGVRWGVDAAHRGEHAQPETDDNTWQRGLSRLALGYSSALSADQLFEGCAPAPVDSGQAELLGRFMEFCSTLFELRGSVMSVADASGWTLRIGEVVRVMFGDRADPAERKQLIRALRELEEHAQRAGFAEAFELTSLRRLLARALGARNAAHGFLASGVTFCQMLPMRSIPFKVLCLIGLNDGVFPASDTPFAFDLMQKQRRLGDRSRKDDDRQLLLEALLSAREHMILSFVGQSQQTGKPLPASVLVYELIEQVARSCELPGQPAAASALVRSAAMEQRLVLRHPLTSASPRYFGADADPRLFSFARGSCAAARASQARSDLTLTAAAPFAVLHTPLGERPPVVALHELERALMRPSREFCQRRLNLYLGDDLSTLPEREPFELNALERWQIATEWLEHVMLNRPEASRFEVQRARGRLPHFVRGERAYDLLHGEVDTIARAFTALTEGSAPRSVPVDLTLSVGGADVRLVGSIGDVFPGGHVRVQYSELGKRHELRQFVRYIVLRCLAEQGAARDLPAHSILIGRRKGSEIGQVRFELAAEPRPVLEELLALYFEVLSGPLPLFASASRRYAEQVVSGHAEDAALRAARTVFGDRRASAERGVDLADAYVQQLFDDFERMHAAASGDFERSARRLYTPLLEARHA
ncbi:MAG: exodeoxyribonuclease V subunit gamma [Polyangiales bacterium]